MSCPADNAPIQSRLEKALSVDDIELPVSFYVLTVAMIATVAIIPFLYKQFWLLIFDFNAAIQHARKGPVPPPGCRKIGKPADRNLSKEFKGKVGPGNGHVEDELSIGKVVALFQYPVKSCYGIEMNEAEVLQTGFQFDRQFCFGQLTTSQPKTETGKVSSFWNIVTQRTHPALTLVKTEIWIPDSTSTSYDKDNAFIKSGGCLLLSFPFSPFLSIDIDGLKGLWTIFIAKLAHLSFSAEPRIYIHIPLKPDTGRIKSKNYKFEDVTVHEDVYPQALDMRPDIDLECLAKLKYFLGVSNPFTLFRANPQSPRPLYGCAPREEQLGYEANVGLADSYPIHLLNIASIADLEAKVPRNGPFTEDARRYRGNIYISGAPAYDEDNWTLIKLGDKKFHVSCRTTRCKLPNTNPDTAVQDRKGNQPNSTMLKFRVIDAGSRSPCLGMMLVPSKEAVGAVLRVGDSLEVLETGEHYFRS